MANSYETMLREVLMEGSSRPDRTGTGTTSLFGGRIEYDLRNGFPLITSKRVPFRLVAEELLWFLRGEEDIRSLQERDVHIWDEWADKYGYIGPMYGFQWRRWGERYDEFSDGPTPGEDQIAQVIESIKTDPYSRRHVVSTWNPTEIPYMALAPCHIMFQFYVEEDDVLSIQVYQRSADMFLGVPFNIASYALLTHMVAHVTGYGVGRLIWVGGDCHIYDNHRDQVKEQLSREHVPLPELEIVGDVANIDDFTIDNFKVEEYNPHPTLKGVVAV